MSSGHSMSSCQWKLRGSREHPTQCTVHYVIEVQADLDVLSFVVECMYRLELEYQSLWLAPYQPCVGWNNGVISLSLSLAGFLHPLSDRGCCTDTF